MKTKKERIEPVHKLVALKVMHTRQVLGWTQDELAKKINISRPSIVNMEAGRQRFTLEMIERICSVFQMTTKQFMRGIWF